MAVTEEQHAAFLVGTVPPQGFSPEELKDMSDEEILTDTMGKVFDELGPYFLHSATDTESTPDQIDWEKYRALNVLPGLEGVKRFWKASANTIITSPHFHLDKSHDTLPVGDDLGLKIYDHAKSGMTPFKQVAAAHGREDLKKKIDVPEAAGMAMIYFGLDTVLGGMKKALFHRDGAGIKRAFWDGMATFEDKYRQPYTEATTNQMNKVFADPELRDNVEVQISFPTTHALVNLLYLGNAVSKHLVSPGFRDEATEYLAETVAGMFNAVPEDVSSVGHECETNLNPGHWAGTLYRPSKSKQWSTQASVDYVNAILGHIESGHEPRAMQVAMTHEAPPSLNRETRRPLRDWPKHVRLIAGIIDSRADVEHHLKAHDIIEETAGTITDVSDPCGLGRHREEMLGPEGRNEAWNHILLQRDVVKALNRPL
jgi:hypothetical protein